MREFWQDAEIQIDLSDSERWTLVGLWMLADDGGFLDWDLRYIGSQLYNHEDRAEREQKVTDHLAAIVRAKKAKKFACGHVFLPAAAEYGRPGRKLHGVGDYGARDAHAGEPSRKMGQHSSKNGQRSEKITPPYLTSPNLNPSPTSPLESCKPRARPRGAALSTVGDEIGELKRKVGWEG
ncbi:MAG TPA: hypothetical protein VI341_13750 [Actinomycetota bacterium]